MARGWESKSVEDQIAESEAGKDTRVKQQLSVAERAHHERRVSLMLARARVVHDLEAAQHDRHREMLGRALEHLDSALRELDP